MLASLLTGVLLAGSVTAQEEKGSIALNQFDPAPAGDSFFNVPSPYAYGEVVEPRAQIAIDYAEKPLRLFDNDQEANVVGRQVFMNVGVSAAIVDRLLLSVTLPVALIQSGDSPTIQGVAAPSPTSTQVGDLRAGARVRLYGEPEEPFQLGVGTYIYVPTGSGNSFVSESNVRAYPYLAAGGQFEGGVPWVWTAAVGADVRGSDNPSGLRYGAGIAAVLLEDHLQLGPEVYATTPFFTRDFQLTERDKLSTNLNTNVEGLLGARIRVWHFQAGVAGGPGFTRAVGTPSFRLAWTLSYNPPVGREDTSGNDTDGDGILNRNDACPYAHGPHNANPKSNGCPVLDDDEDGVPNSVDACPNDYGPPNDANQGDGCPAVPVARRRGGRSAG